MKTPYIFPSGTLMRDVPPDAQGITWKQWQLSQVRTPAVTPAEVQAWLDKHPAPRRMPGMEQAK